jgi:hypothetical protein
VNDWYNQPVSVSFSASDALSGLESCPAAVNYQGPDSSTAVVSGTCLDKAGNGALASRLLKYDDTAPMANGVPSRPADANGGTILAHGGLAPGRDLRHRFLHGVERLRGPDTAAVSRERPADKAGNPSVDDLPFRTTPRPTVGPTARQAAGPGRWYNHQSFAVQGTDAMSGIDSYPPRLPGGQRDASFAGACLDKAGNLG